MPTKISRDTAQAFVALVDSHNGNTAAAARDAGVSRSTLFHRLGAARKFHGLTPRAAAAIDANTNVKPGFSVVEQSNGETLVTSISERIKSIDDALGKAGVDLAAWEIKEKTVNEYQVAMKLHAGHEARNVRRPDVPITKTLYQIRIVLRRRASKAIIDGLDLIHKRAEKFSPRYKFPRAGKPDGDLLAALCLFDVHFGKLCWEQETGKGGNYDLKVAGNVWRNAVVDLARYIKPLGIRRVYIPIGQDFVNFDNTQGSTTAGTPQDNDGRYAKVIDAAYWSLVWAIDYLLAELPGVEVEAEYVPGNHDLTVSYHLCRELKAHYRHCGRVSVGVEFRKRKYKRWGTVLIGASHAENVHKKWDQLPTLMATEVPADWAATTHREWLLGHVHSKAKHETLPVEEKTGCTCRTIQSLCKADFYHYDRGYLSGRSAEVHLYSEARGYVGCFNANARECANA